MTSFIQSAIDALAGSYVGIFFLMALESSLFPVPSELVMIPAGYLAKSGGLDPFLAVLAGGAGSLLGASANYLLGKYVGKPFILNYGKYFLIKREKYEEAEVLFDRNDRLYTFLGRFIPVIRHLISIPAGIFRMPYAVFAALTFLGASIWCGLLVWLGYAFGKPVLDTVRTYSHEASLVAVVALVGFIAWFLFHSTKKRSAKRP